MRAESRWREHRGGIWCLVCLWDVSHPELCHHWTGGLGIFVDWQEGSWAAFGSHTRELHHVSLAVGHPGKQ